MPTLDERVAKIEERNRAVELDKAWETSIARRAVIVAFTYVVVGVFLRIIEVERPWVAAIVPAIGFALSTITLPYLKRRWIDGLKKSGTAV